MENTPLSNSVSEYTSEPQASSSIFSWLDIFKVAVVGLLIILPIVGVGGYYFGKQNSVNYDYKSIVATPASSQPAEQNRAICTQEAKICPDGSSVGRIGPNCEFTECPIFGSVSAQSDPITENWQVFTKPEWGLSLKYPQEYVLINNDKNKVEIGFDGFTYITIFMQPKDYDESNICSSTTAKYPCINATNFGQSEPITFITVGKMQAKSFYVSEGESDSDFHIVTTNSQDPIQFTAYISGGGLDQRFQQVLSTVELK
jgi:hypothetical protein